MINLDKLSENQTLEKSALIVAGTGLISAGSAMLGGSDTVTPLVLIGLGVLCLLVRELVKLKN